MVDSHKPDTSVAHLELSTGKGVEDLKSLFLSLAVHLPFFLHFFPLASFGTYFFFLWLSSFVPLQIIYLTKDITILIGKRKIKITHTHTLDMILIKSLMEVITCKKKRIK